MNGSLDYALTARGSLDTTFNPCSGANGAVNSIAVQTVGGQDKIIIGGTFTLEPRTPTIARVVPAKNSLALGQVRLPKPPQMVAPSVVVRFANHGLGYEHFEKLAYI